MLMSDVCLTFFSVCLSRTSDNREA